MPKQTIESHIKETLAGDTRKNALDFVAFLLANEMQFERGEGYWKDKLYWCIKHENESVCYLLLNSPKENLKPWTIWSDDSGSNCFEDCSLDEYMKEIAWDNVDFCGNCGGDCSPGTRKVVFGKEFNNVCRAAMRFTNPDAETVECMKKLVEIRKNHIDLSTSTSHNRPLSSNRIIRLRP